MKKKILRITSIFVLVIITIGFGFYFSSTKKEKNKIKKHFLYKLGIYKSDWSKETSNIGEAYITTFNSSSLLVDDIYTSMEGPYTYRWFQLDETEDELYWITKLNSSISSKFDVDSISNDFFCHANLYHSDVEHFTRLGLQDRMNYQKESQMITLTKGVLSVEFPKGFGYPIYSNEKIQIGAQAVNLNKEDDWFKVNFNFNLHYNKDREKRLKPLFMKYLVMAFPYDPENYDTVSSEVKNMVLCAGPESDQRFKNKDALGNDFTGFWRIPKGKHTFRSDVSGYLTFKDSLVAHYINAHVHPFATSLELRDTTADVSIFKSIITNSKEKKGLENITTFSSEEGIIFYPGHKYEMILEANNTTDKVVDMMGSMFVYFYDKELYKKLNDSQP